jgi:hypothetical protein
MTLPRMADRSRPNIRLTEPARAGWDRLCTTERVTLTGLMEAIGLELAEGHHIIPASVIERAATIDRNRKSRR